MDIKKIITEHLEGSPFNGNEALIDKIEAEIAPKLAAKAHKLISERVLARAFKSLVKKSEDKSKTN